LESIGRICPGAPVAAIINPENSGLSYGGGIAAIISNEGGPKIEEHCAKYIEKVRTYYGYQSSSDNSRQSAIQGIIHAVGPRNPSLKLWKEGIKVSRPIKGKPTRDWTKVFNCPKCEDGRLRMKIKEDALVCEKCGYRKPFKVDYSKIPRVIDG